MTSFFPSPSDADLAEINGLLDWHAGTLLPDGRLLGRLERTPGKRPEPAKIPDSRIRLLNRTVPLAKLKVLEIGCFEGIHTVGLRQYCADVTAIDVRPQNVLKTLARLSWHGFSARVLQADAEQITADFGLFDVIFHVGVLYHMMKPVEHLRNMASACKYLFLDTHVARDEPNMRVLEVGGRCYRVAAHPEGGWSDPFSGKDRQALWLTRESLMDALGDAGFIETRVLQERSERNGPRLLLIAARAPFPPPKQAAVKAEMKPVKNKGETIASAKAKATTDVR